MGSVRSQSGGGPQAEGPDPSPADEAWSLLTTLAFRTMRERFIATVAQLDLSPPQAQALKSLEPGRPMPMHELADHLRCDPSYATGLVDRLEARGLVERPAAPGDRRGKTLVGTGAGAGPPR